MNENLTAKIKESAHSVLPISAIVLGIHFLVAPTPTGTLALFAAGTLRLVVGMGIFTLGSEMAMMPIGEIMGSRLTSSRNLPLMEAAKSVHASGSTIIKGRETGMKDGEKFFGVAIQPEKEIVMILTPKEFRDPIMAAIQEKAGPHSKARTFAVTLPARDTAGLSPELKK